MTVKTRSHDDFMAEVFRKDPEHAIELLNEILEDGAWGEAMIVLRQMSKAFGGVREVAEKSGLHGKTLYRTLSPKGNPQVSTLDAVLRAMGLRLAVQPVMSATSTA